MRVTYLGHSTVLIEIDGARVLTDPLLRGRVAHLRRISPAAPAHALEGLDLVLVSHGHHDHLDVRSLRALPGSPRVLSPASGRAPISRAGLRPEIIRSGDVIRVGDLRVEAVRADHDGRRWPASRKREALGFVLRGSAVSVYFAGDTGLFEAMAEITGVDVALMPVAGWGPKLGPGHLDPESAARATALVEPRIAIPIHWGGYRRMLMRDDGARDEPARRFAAAVAKLAPRVEAEILQPGASLTVEPPS